MTDFDDFEIYDETLAEEGIWVPVMRNGKKLMEAKLRYVDAYTQAGELEYKRARAPFAKLAKVGALSDMDSIIIALTSVHMRDWRGVTAGGKPVEYTPAVAREFFKRERNRAIAVELMNVAANPENFVQDEEFSDVEGVTKN